MGIINCCYDNSPSLDFKRVDRVSTQINILDPKNQVDFFAKLNSEKIQRKLDSINSYISSYPFKNPAN